MIKPRVSLMKVNVDGNVVNVYILPPEYRPFILWQKYLNEYVVLPKKLIIINNNLYNTSQLIKPHSCPYICLIRIIQSILYITIIQFLLFILLIIITSYSYTLKPIWPSNNLVWISYAWIPNVYGYTPTVQYIVDG